ncbi:MAG: hypothetical protein WC917_00240 [Bacilli bacterium]|jgi:hypothetical protein
MKGYHYTSYENWQKIQKQGLIPYLIKHPDIMNYIPDPIYGIFTWTKDHREEAHIGNILFQKASKNSNRIVKLCFTYNEKDILYYKGAMVKLYHYGEITGSTGGHENSSSSYHTGQQAFIITRPVEPRNIRLVGDYDLNKLLK